MKVCQRFSPSIPYRQGFNGTASWIRSQSIFIVQLLLRCNSLCSDSLTASGKCPSSDVFLCRHRKTRSSVLRKLSLIPVTVLNYFSIASILQIMWNNKKKKLDLDFFEQAVTSLILLQVSGSEWMGDIAMMVSVAFIVKILWSWERKPKCLTVI